MASSLISIEYGRGRRLRLQDMVVQDCNFSTERLRKEDYFKFEAILGYIMRLTKQNKTSRIKATAFSLSYHSSAVVGDEEAGVGVGGQGWGRSYLSIEILAIVSCNSKQAQQPFVFVGTICSPPNPKSQRETVQAQLQSSG